MRNFSARETEWLQELDGIELASFWQRTCAFLIDWMIIWFFFSIFAIIVGAAYLGVRHLEGKPMPAVVQFLENRPGKNDGAVLEKKYGNALDVHVQNSDDDEIQHILTDILLPILYFGTLLWKGKGQTPGKRIMKIRVVSLVHRHITFWHSVERALGYGVAGLELGFGFLQFFVHPYRRCAQDRLAETIVVTERSYQAFQHKRAHPLIADGSPKPQPNLTEAIELSRCQQFLQVQRPRHHL